MHLSSLIRFCPSVCQVGTTSRDAIVMEVVELLHPFIIVKIVVVVSTRNGQTFQLELSMKILNFILPPE